MICTVEHFLSGLLLSGHLLNLAADSMLILQKLWAVHWVWPIIAYIFLLYSEIRTSLSYRRPIIPRCPDKRGLTVPQVPIFNVSVPQINFSIHPSQKLTIKVQKFCSLFRDEKKGICLASMCIMFLMLLLISLSDYNSL